MSLSSKFDCYDTFQLDAFSNHFSIGCLLRPLGLIWLRPLSASLRVAPAGRRIGLNLYSAGFRWIQSHTLHYTFVQTICLDPYSAGFGWIWFHTLHYSFVCLTCVQTIGLHLHSVRFRRVIVLFYHSSVNVKESNPVPHYLNVPMGTILKQAGFLCTRVHDSIVARSDCLPAGLSISWSTPAEKQIGEPAPTNGGSQLEQKLLIYLINFSPLHRNFLRLFN